MRVFACKGVVALVEQGRTVVRRSAEGATSMLEDPDDPEQPLSHEPPCVRCGHSAHPYLPCGGGCDCEPTLMPGEDRLSRT
jgi:hypothetical protein